MIFRDDSLNLIIFYVISGHLMYSKMKKEITESQVNFCNTSQISVPVSSVN